MAKKEINERLSTVLDDEVRPRVAMIPVTDNRLFSLFAQVVHKKGGSLEDVLHDLIFDYVFRDGSISNRFDSYYIRKEDLEAQAENLLHSTLVEYEIQSIREAAAHNHLTLWQQLLSYVRTAIEQGQAYVVNCNPEWFEKGLKVKDTFICKGCGKEYPLKRVGQMFCSNACAAQSGR
ncbi:MAG: hypothetical protein QW561_00480 [Candidatus Aenigmatarchaeota archaeon]